jgi:phage/plasmid-like protein (TIGR03299 family)
MAHNINRNRNTGKDAFFSVKQKAWHGLGQIVDDYPTSAEAIIHAGLDYEVEKRKLFTYDANNNSEATAPDQIQIPEVEIPNYFATVRKDTDDVLGIVGSKYEVVQNRDAFVFFDSLVNDGSGIKYETAGALGNGERIFITAKMPDVIKVGRKDVIEEYIFLTTSHDGSGSIMAAFTPVRIVCNNTLNMALKEHSNAVFIKHTANAETKLKEAAKIIAISHNMSEQLETLFNRWSKVRINDAELMKLIQLAMSPSAEVFKAVAEEDSSYEFTKHFETVCGEVYQYAMVSDTQQMETTAGTLFGAYNAVTGYYQNVKSYKNDNAKLDSLMFGTALDRTKKAFEICSKANDFLS